MDTTPARTKSNASSPSRSRLLVRDFMTATPHTIGRKQTLAVAQEKMRAIGVRHLPVLEGGRLEGILSQRDAYFIETLSGVTAENVLVEETMSIDVYTVTPETPLLEVATAMADHKYGPPTAGKVGLPQAARRRFSTSHASWSVRRFSRIPDAAFARRRTIEDELARRIGVPYP